MRPTIARSLTVPITAAGPMSPQGNQRRAAPHKMSVGAPVPQPSSKRAHREDPHRRDRRPATNKPSISRWLRRRPPPCPAEPVSAGSEGWCSRLRALIPSLRAPRLTALPSRSIVASRRRRPFRRTPSVPPGAAPALQATPGRRGQSVGGQALQNPALDADRGAAKKRLLGFQEKTACIEIGIKGVRRPAAAQTAGREHARPRHFLIQPRRNTRAISGPEPPAFLRRGWRGYRRLHPCSRPAQQLPHAAQRTPSSRSTGSKNPCTTRHAEALADPAPAPRYPFTAQTWPRRPGKPAHGLPELPSNASIAGGIRTCTTKQSQVGKPRTARPERPGKAVAGRLWLEGPPAEETPHGSLDDLGRWQAHRGGEATTRTLAPSARYVSSRLRPPIPGTRSMSAEEQRITPGHGGRSRARINPPPPE